jgi:hypothetical protein
MRSRRRGEGHCSRRRELADSPRGNGAGGQTIGEAALGAFCSSAEGRGGERVAAFSERGAERVPALVASRQGDRIGAGWRVWAQQPLAGRSAAEMGPGEVWRRGGGVWAQRVGRPGCAFLFGGRGRWSDSMGWFAGSGTRRVFAGAVFR